MLSTLLTSIGLPIVLDLIKSAAPAVTRKVFGVSAEDQIKLANSDIERMRALALLDTPGGTPSQWVIDLRASFRYVAAAMLIVNGAGLAIYGAYETNPGLIAGGLDMASAPFGFIFGERLVLSFKTGGK